MSQTVIIVGAPRSGTNMLRDVLTAAPGIGTWDCDELPLLWRHGNLDVPHDELTPAHARPEVRGYLRRQFARAARRFEADVLVEKTCATSLRVGFAATVFPDARFLFIRRDGLDATASTMKRWNAPFDLRYTAKKARYVPPVDVPRHAADLLRRRATQLVRGEAGRDAADQVVSTWWGPRPHDFRDLQRRHPLEELAFIQWQRCVTQAADELAALPPERVLEVGYEDFVADPRAGTATILGFLGRPELLDRTGHAAVRPDSVGKGRTTMGAEAVARLEALGADTLRRFGYA
jgi:hypothetical protein